MGGEPFYHAVILQKLNAYLQNNGRQVFYSLESFLNTDDWTGIPLIFKKVGEGQPMHHPEHDAVTNMHLGEGEKLVGKVDYAFVPNEGQPRLNAYLAIEDLEVEALAREGKLGLSTSFEAETIPETEDAEGPVRIVGTVRPNHVLLFEQNSCPNCWPNDGAALFENTKEHAEMTAPTDNETKGWIKSIYEKFCNVKSDAEPESKEPAKVNETMDNVEEIKTELTQLKNALAQRDARIAELEAAEAQRVKDAAWDAMKNTLPKGWITEGKEKETRDLFENNKDQFYLNLMQHKEKFGNAQAEGKTAAGCGCQNEKAQMDNIRNAVNEATGFTIMTED